METHLGKNRDIKLHMAIGIPKPLLLKNYKSLSNSFIRNSNPAEHVLSSLICGKWKR